MALVQTSSPLRTQGALNTISLPSVAAGNAIVVVCSNFGSGFTSVTGSVNGAFQKAIGIIDNGNNAVEIWRKENTSAGSETISFGVTSATGDTYISATAQEWSGVLTTGALDRTGTGADSLTATASAANTQADVLVIHATVCDTGNSALGFGTSSGYTLIDRENDSNNYTGYQAAYKVVAATETSTGTATSSALAGSNFDSVIATFKLSSGGTSPTTATAAAGVATVSGAGASRAVSTGTAAAGAAAVSASAKATTKSNATAANGIATVSASATGAAKSMVTPAAGVAVVSGVGGSLASSQGQAAGSASVSAAGSSNAAAAGPAAGVATTSGSGSALSVTTVEPAAGSATVSAVGSTEAPGQASAVPAAGTSVVSALASSLVTASTIPAAGSSSASATSPTVAGRTSGGSGGGKVRNRNYDYSSPQAEPVKAKVDTPKPTKKKQKAVSPDMVEMLALLDSSQVATAQVLAEQAAQRAEEMRMQAAQDIEDDMIAAIVAACL